MFNKILKPDVYHGIGHISNFFEGWYFKITDKDRKNTFVAIPGVYKSPKGVEDARSEAFIQLIYYNGERADSFSRFVKYPLEMFAGDSKNFYVDIENNIFTLFNMALLIDEPDVSVSGTVNFQDVVTWPSTLLNPGSMGYFNYLTFLQCKSQVCSLNGITSGDLIINGRKVSFNGGRVYIEKNWGSCFPDSWIWAQSNTFANHPVASVTCSIAKVPFMQKAFTGFIIGFMYENRFLEFSTVNKSKLNINKVCDNTQVNYPNIKITASSKNYTLTCEINVSDAVFYPLKMPKGGEMSSGVMESVNGELIVSLRENFSKTIIFSDTALCGGVEIQASKLNFNY